MADPPADSDTSLLSDMSSDLSSLGSKSPSPAPGLLTPSLSQDQSPSDDSGKDDDNKKKRKAEGAEGEETKKRRKRPEPKPRTTKRLDFTRHPRTFATEQKDELEILLKVLKRRRKIVVIAGAGISVSAGIPDFRSSNGLFKSLKSEHKLKASGKQLFDASVYQTDSSTTSFHTMVRSLSNLASSAQPTAFHKLLSTLGSEGRLMRLYTQNVDGIDVALPSLETSVPLAPKGPWPRTVQLHGGLEKMVCSKCGEVSDFEPELFDGPLPPPCGRCEEADELRTSHAGKRSHGIGRLRPRIVLYNEHNPDEEAIGSVVSADLRSRPDAIIVVGTSMKIPGVRRIVREMCGVVRGRRDGIAVWLNQDGPPPGKEFEDCWDLIIKGPCDEVARQWDVSVNGPSEEYQKILAEEPKVLTPEPSPAPKIKQKLILNPPKPLKPGQKGTKAKGKAAPKKTTKVKTKDGKTSAADKDKKKEKPLTAKFKPTKPVSRPRKKSSPAPAAKNPATTTTSATAAAPPAPAAPAKQPMEPLSPSAARVNGPPTTATPAPLPPPKFTLPPLQPGIKTGSPTSMSPVLLRSPASPGAEVFDLGFGAAVSSSSAASSPPPPLQQGIVFQAGGGGGVQGKVVERTVVVRERTVSGESMGMREGTISPKAVPKGMEMLLS